MKKTEVYQIRLNREEKQQAFEVFQALGISPAQAVRLFFKQVVRTQSIPFSITQELMDAQAAAFKPTDRQQAATIVDELNALLQESRKP